MNILKLATLLVPLFLHFRNKNTKEVTKFSTLMFLEPAPIKQKQKSQIQHWLLLLLRCLILGLLALAFARPLLFNGLAALGGTQPEKVIILMDRSASMQREDLWEQAVSKLIELKKDFPEIKLYQVYLDRIQDLREQTLTQDWDGVFRHTSK